MLATLLLFYADPARLGGTRMTRSGPRQHPAVVAIARAIGRTENAVVRKVQTLRSKLTEGRRGLAHGANLETWALDLFHDRLDLLVAAAMRVADELPGAREAVERLTSIGNISADPEGGLSDQESPPVASGPPVTSVERRVLVRRGQALFRSRVMANYRYTCAFCGLRARQPSSSTYFLVAGHILPWADATDHQRMDPRNGLALCPIHDRAFEWGFMSLTADLLIRVSPAVRSHYAPEELVHAELLSLHERPLRTDLREIDRPAASYLEYHQERVFERRFRCEA